MGSILGTEDSPEAGGANDMNEEYSNHTQTQTANNLTVHTNSALVMKELQTKAVLRHGLQGRSKGQQRTQWRTKRTKEDTEDTAFPGQSDNT